MLLHCKFLVFMAKSMHCKFFLVWRIYIDAEGQLITMVTLFSYCPDVFLYKMKQQNSFSTIYREIIENRYSIYRTPRKLDQK